MLRKILFSFFSWYEQHYALNVGLASFLFVWQLVHLYWLTTHVVFLRLFNISLFNFQGIWQYLIIVVDYTEIPALITTSIIYIHELTKRFSWKSVWFLIFLNSQWLHLFWITDEFIVEQFTGSMTKILPIWLAPSPYGAGLVWFAIFIDYLELPVIYDTVNKFFVSLRKRM